MTDEGRKVIKKVVANCRICKKFRRSFGTPKVAIPKALDFNEIVALDLKKIGSKHILWIICTFTRFIKGIVIRDKEAETIIEAVQSGWNLNYGYASLGFYADNGPEFKNEKMYELTNKLNLKISFGPPYFPWCNAINERNHYSADIAVSKILESESKKDLQTALNLASWTHNTNVNKLGYSPLHLVTGKSVVFPGISVGNPATDSMSENEAVRRIVERHPKITEQFRKSKYLEKLKQAGCTRVRSFQHSRFSAGDKIFFQRKNNKGWDGPAEVFCQKGNEIWLWANGDLKRVNVCRVQKYPEDEGDVESETHPNVTEKKPLQKSLQSDI